MIYLKEEMRKKSGQGLLLKRDRPWEAKGEVEIRAECAKKEAAHYEIII